MHIPHRLAVVQKNLSQNSRLQIENSILGRDSRVRRTGAELLEAVPEAAGGEEPFPRRKGADQHEARGLQVLLRLTHVVPMMQQSH